MNYVKRTVQSQPGLSQEQALTSLQSHPSFKAGTRIASIRRKGSKWVAELLEPKLAGPPPAFADDGGDDEGAPDAGGSEPDEGPDEGPDGPPSDGPDGPPSDEGGEDGPPSGEKKPKGEKGGKPNVEAEILHVLQQILQAVGGDAPGPEGMGGPDALGPDAGGPAAPPAPHHGPGPGGPDGPPHGGPAGPPAGRPMKPGEAPPGSTPVGAPAFSSTRQADIAPMAPGAPAPGAGTAPVPSGQVGPTGGATCPECGYPEPCPMHGAGAQTPMAPAIAAVREQVQKVAGRSAQVTIKAPGSMKIGDAVKVAKAASEPFGYEVKKASRVGDRIIILAYARR